MTEAVTQASVEHATPVPTGSVDTGYDEDAELRSVFNQMTRDNGAERGDDGKFTSGADENGAAASQSEPAPVETPAADAVAIPMPANWFGKEAAWQKIPPEVRAEIAEHQNGIHAKMTDQGRQISAFRPVQEVIEQHRDLLERHRTSDGQPVTPQMAVNFLFNAQRKLEADPAGALIEIADTFGARNALIAALVSAGGAVPQGRQPQASHPPQQAGLSPADVARVVEEKLSEASMQSELSRLASAKPLYAEIDQEDMVHAIHKARARLGETAAYEAVFDLAYDMAVNADPDLRTKAAAAKTPAAPPSDPKKTADAKRANAVNVTSTSSGSAAPLSEDEELRAVYRKASKG